MRTLGPLFAATLSLVGLTGFETIASAQSCSPVVKFYPVRGRHNHGYDSTAGDSSQWSCGDANSNSDFVGNRRHIGNDVWAPEGTPVVAVTSGVLGFVGFEEYPGWNVHITDACGWVHWSGHLQSIAPGLATGNRIEAGTVIGYVGRSGVGSNGVVHLHYSICPPDDYYAGVDPWPYLHAVEQNTCSLPCVGEACAEERLLQMPSTYAPPRTTDIDGDGRADVCARASDGIHCSLGQAGTNVGAEKVLLPLSNEAGWADPSNYATLRMGDIDGDGRADLCARSDAGVECWSSAKTPFGTPIAGPRFGDASGFGHVRYFSTLRLLDIDGDGKDDLCARGVSGITCHLSTGTGFGPAIVGPSWSDANGFGSAKHYGTLRAGDINGDGKDDLCIRTTTGVECAVATGSGFESVTVKGPAWSDAAGWGDLMYWSSIRLVDVNGDGKADLCARSSQRLACHFSTGIGFGAEVVVDALSNDLGWSDPSNYTTLRTGDVDGDGATDLCIRSNAEMRCYLWKDDKFETVLGPTWADGNGWGNAQHHETIRLGDVDGDGKADLCARSIAGWECSRSTGTAFLPSAPSPVFADAAGWHARPYFDTILFASTRPAPDTAGKGGAGDDGDKGTESGAEDASTSEASGSCSVGAPGGARVGAASLGLGAALSVLVMGRRRGRRLPSIRS